MVLLLRMNRRKLLRTIKLGVVVVAAHLVGICAKVYGAWSKWSWPGYPSESSLRNHLKTSSNHRDVSSATVNGTRTLQSLASLHDASHKRRGDSPRWSRGSGKRTTSDSSPAPKPNPKPNKERTNAHTKTRFNQVGE